MALLEPEELDEVRKKDVIDFCRNGVMPLTFQEKMRMLSDDGGPGCSDGDGCGNDGSVGATVFLRFASGGLMSRSIPG